jgi:Tfp pilus assembly protein PilO
MATLEERIQALEQEHTELKKTIELQTMAIGALVNKATLEKLNEKYDKLFQTLITHDGFNNEQLSELRNEATELDGKIVGLQTEMHKRFNDQDGKIVGLQTEMRQQFSQIQTTLTQILARLPEKPE